MKKKPIIELLKEKIFNKESETNSIFTKLAESHALLVPIFSSLFAFVCWGFNFFYEVNCRTYYGVTLKCFDSDVYQFRWFVIIVLAIFSFLYTLLIIFFIKKLTMRFDFIFDIVIQGILLSTVNLTVLLFIISVPLNSNVVNWIYSHQVISVLFLFGFSLFFSIVLSLIVRLTIIHKKMITVVKIAAFFCAVLQFFYFCAFAYTYASPHPKNITQYTVVTAETENSKSDNIENYIVIGTYEGDFVCEKIISCNGNADYLNDEIDYVLDNSDINVKKYEYKIFSSDEIVTFKTINFHSVNLV